MDTYLIQEIKDIHFDPQAIKDAGGTIDDQLLEEHRTLLIRRVGDLAEKVRVEIRNDRRDKIKRAKKDIKSKDELKQELKNIDKWAELGENTITLLEEAKIKELQNV